MANLYKCGGGSNNKFVFPRIELNGGTSQSITSGSSTTRYYKTVFRLPSGVKKLKIEQLRFIGSTTLQKVYVETVVDEDQIKVYTVDTDNIELDLSGYTRDVCIYSYSSVISGTGDALYRPAVYMLNVSLEF